MTGHVYILEISNAKIVVFQNALVKNAFVVDK